MGAAGAPGGLSSSRVGVQLPRASTIFTYQFDRQIFYHNMKFCQDINGIFLPADRSSLLALVLNRSLAQEDKDNPASFAASSKACFSCSKSRI